MTTVDTVNVSQEAYDKYKAAWDDRHAKYGDYDDDQIDKIIDMRVQQRVSEWEQKIGAVTLQSEIQRIHELQKQAKINMDNVLTQGVELRSVMLEDSVSLPVPEPDMSMEALIR